VDVAVMGGGYRRFPKPKSLIHMPPPDDVNTVPSADNFAAAVTTVG
jgi:hypothetical protein